MGGVDKSKRKVDALPDLNGVYVTTGPSLSFAAGAPAPGQPAGRTPRSRRGRRGGARRSA